MWSLAPGMRHLNHGSFGAIPIEVQEKQSEWRARWEANTTAFIFTEVQTAIDEARESLAGFIGADPEGVVFVRNASLGVAAVVRSIEPTLGPGEEIVTTLHDYNTVRQTLEFSASAHGARVVVAAIPFPIDGPETVIRIVLDAVSDRTKLVVIDHVTSPTGLVFPVDEIVTSLEPDVPVLVDGAHGPGQVPLAVDQLGASWYTGNLHKWACAPKGAAFLHTREDRIDQTVPTVISHGWNGPMLERGSRYRALFDWVGTDDMTPWLVVPDAIRVVGGLEKGGWPALMRRNRELALAARDVLCEALGIGHPAPDEMIASMAAMPLANGEGVDPGGLLSPVNFELIEAGYETLVMIWPAWPGQVLRVSAHHYNELAEYESLASYLSQEAG